MVKPKMDLVLLLLYTVRIYVGPGPEGFFCFEKLEPNKGIK